MPNQAQRLSVLAQTIDLIQEGICTGRWLDVLPQERLLCEELNVSRSTIRRALPKIEEMKLIAPAQRGVRRRILIQAAPATSSSQEPTSQTSPSKIAWLTGDDATHLPSFIKGLYIDTQKRLEAHNCELRIVTLPHRPLHQPEKYLAEWIKDYPRDAWILHSMPDNVQSWFSKHQPNAYLFGNRAPGINLGAINIEPSAPVSHALNKFRKLGHKRLGLTRRAGSLVGEQLVETAFTSSLDEEELSKSKLLACPDDAAMIHTLFEKVFLNSGQNYPTALLCTLPHLAYALLTWLQQHQVSIPTHVSIVLLRSQRLLEFTYPSIAHYAINESRIVPAALPALLDLAQTGSCSTSEITLMPEFVSGDSLGKAP